ncbi:uncharacterized protein TRIVIDRAFT_220620 [Trichoderma virens Gv29-8]|uniref:Uncharacterized protein n=1 Tax=Hypocrea virens (strain Gv29-8 / FGSC 10586) TaxID=413071 RepID=G9MN91_HYPVG|nr:uncharacterized protein TRIVIDRAFT_220620 [Trichoderma virens Gv29-8]EHK23347.1 hypothetical protein TRIVIDRAFT_220620 [Trichoderma virens Gv29-8]UKZ49650.1 hypothetical protein TrVGV298_003897 [Trichoderma virens]
MPQQRFFQHSIEPRPISELGWIRGSYKTHLSKWLRSQALCWDPSMLATKLGRDIEIQITRDKRTFDVANLMRAVTYLHAELVYYGVSTHEDPHQVWRDVLQYANPRFVVMWPKLKEMAEEDEFVITKDEFLAEFDAFVKENRLNGKVVVLMNCPDCERWDEQNFHQNSLMD